jgi:quercetin dioxygenase-like cupin family protein
MRRTVLLSGMTLAVGITVGAIGHHVVSAQAPVKVSELVKTDLAEAGGKEASIFFVEIAPGGAVGKHYHPGDAYAYIIEGSMILELPGKPPVTMHRGHAGHVAPRQVHDDKNASGTAPLKFLVFHVAEKGQPLAVSAQ